MQADELLTPIISSETDKKREYKNRKTTYSFKTIVQSRIDNYIQEGWEQVKKLKTGVRIRKIKDSHEIVENKIWCLLYKMGFHDLNSGSDFQIHYKTTGNCVESEQISAFAKDDDTVLIAKCISQNNISKRDLSKELASFSSIKARIANSVKKYYGSEFKPKILWIFFTHNIVWTKEDIEKAKNNKIKIITEREFEYLNQITKHLGSAARYQFLAEYCGGEDIPNLKHKPVPAIKGRLGGRFFYSFVTTPDHLLKIAFVNHRALDDPRGIPTYQRLIQKSRIKKIEQFIINGGFFPTNILINFSHNLEFEKIKKDSESNIEFGLLHLPPKYKTAWIIDGQHRLYGYANLSEEDKKQNIFVLAFERLPKNKEAELFVTINHEQKSVPRTLLDDLEGDLKWGSAKPNERIGSIGARVIKNINSDIGEPFHGRLVAQGIRGTDTSCLTVPWIKSGLKDSGLIGKSTHNNKDYEAGPLTGTDDDETLANTQLFLNNFFGKIEEANPRRWQQGRTGHLCTNPGVFGYLLLSASLIEHQISNNKLTRNEKSIQNITDAVMTYMEPVISFIKNESDDSFSSKFKVPYGTTGPKQYYFQLCDIINSAHNDFSPNGFSEWKSSRSLEKVQNADTQVKFIQSSVPEYVFKKLKEVHNGNDDYLMLAVNTKTYAKAVERQADDVKLGIKHSIETYFDFSDIIDITTNKNNWKHFQDVLAIPRGSNNKTEQTKWITRVNQLRRNPAHPSPERDYTIDDFTFLDEVCESLDLNFERAGFTPSIAHIGSRS